MYRLIAASIVLGASLLWGSVARAYTVSGTVTYWDARRWAPNIVGSTLTSNGLNRVLPYVKVALMDQDGCFDPTCGGADDDDLYGVGYANANGFYSFEVTQTSGDLYLAVDYEMRTPGGPPNRIRNSLDNPIKAYSPMYAAVTSNFVINMSVSCPTNASGVCGNDAEANLTANRTFNRSANLAASMFHVRTRLGWDRLLPIIGYLGDNPAGSCSQVNPATGASPVGVAFADMTFCVDSGFQNHVIAHEMGHLYHYQAMQFAPGMGLAGPCTGSDSEKCAISEGWADFSMAVAWFNQNATGAFQADVAPSYNFEGDTTVANSSASPCAWNAALPHERIPNAARFFWDLYDSTLVGTGETSAQDKGAIHYGWFLDVWAEFPGGTDNRESSELGEDGRNAKDFRYHASPSDVQSELDLNCLTAQGSL